MVRTTAADQAVVAFTAGQHIDPEATCQNAAARCACQYLGLIGYRDRDRGDDEQTVIINRLDVQDVPGCRFEVDDSAGFDDDRIADNLEQVVAIDNSEQMASGVACIYCRQCRHDGAGGGVLRDGSALSRNRRRRLVADPTKFEIRCAQRREIGVLERDGVAASRGDHDIGPDLGRRL